METYTVEELSKQLKDMGYDVSSRTIKYYAYEKNMLQNLKAGKKSFTKDELDDIIKIQKLKNCTSMKLDEIREFIKNKDVFDIDNYIANQYCTTILKSSSSMNSKKSYADSLNNGINMAMLSSDCSWNNMTTNYAMPLGNSYRGCSIEKLNYDLGAISCYSSSNEKLSIKNESDYHKKEKRSIQVTDDILLTVTKDVNNEKLKKIVNFIKDLK